MSVQSSLLQYFDLNKLMKKICAHTDMCCERKLYVQIIMDTLLWRYIKTWQSWLNCGIHQQHCQQLDLIDIFRILNLTAAEYTIFFFLTIFFLFVVDFVIHWNETAKGLQSIKGMLSR